MVDLFGERENPTIHSTKILLCPLVSSILGEVAHLAGSHHFCGSNATFGIGEPLELTLHRLNLFWGEMQIRLLGLLAFEFFLTSWKAHRSSVRCRPCLDHSS